MHLHFTQKLDQTQYSAALAVTGAWRRTSRQRLYDKLGWETLHHGRSKIMPFLFSVQMQSTRVLLLGDTPAVKSGLKPKKSTLLRAAYCKNNSVLELVIQNTISERNLLDDEIRNSPSISQFEKNLFAIIRPSKYPTHNIRDIQGIRLLTMLRVEFSA